jgi:RNA polymerase sigma-70 factor, ECF subfamily
MNHAARSDGELIEEYRRGRALAFDELVRRYQEPLYGFLYRFTGDSALANDLFQETFLRFIQRLDEYEEDGRFKSWLYQVARNLAMDALRRRQLERGIFSSPPSAHSDDTEQDSDIQDGIADPLSAPDVLLENSELGARLTSAVATLPDDQREVVLLKYQGGLTFREIADITGVSINTVTGRMRYATEKLRKHLGEFAREIST